MTVPNESAPRDKLVALLRQSLPAILAETPVTLAYLYGSQATGLTLPHSDVDVALVLCQPEPLPSKERLHLEFQVEGALEQIGILKPDVRVIDDKPLAFRGEVATQGIRLYARDEAARVEFETRTWKEYFDFKPVLDMMQEALFERMRSNTGNNDD